MPPFLPRKRSPSPISPKSARGKRAKLADVLDAEATNDVPSLRQIETFSLGSDESSVESSLSDIDSDQFEDVPAQYKESRLANDGKGKEAEDEDDDIEWEDAATTDTTKQAAPQIPMENGSIQVTLRNDDDIIDYATAANAGGGKKGPSRREKQARITTHRLHVQFLLWHNAVRNKWIGDKDLQQILVKQLPTQITKEVDKWKRASGLAPSQLAEDSKQKGKKRRKTKMENQRSQRDWGQPSQRLEAGKPDMSHGDPLIALMKVLSAYWKKRFAITMPGLRKRGYGTKLALKQEIASLRNDKHDPEKHGERIKNLTELRQAAREAQGSRDVGAQLFTALLRGLGIEARLVASLQPSGYGWTKVEQMVPKKSARKEVENVSDTESDTATKSKQKSSTSDKKSIGGSNTRHKKSQIISLDSDDDVGEGGDSEVDIKDDNSIIDVTPSMPKQKKAMYDRDLFFPIYWTEVISPITDKVLPVSPLVLDVPVAATEEALSAFEPRGAKAEKGRQVMAYVVAYSSDGTAKDVTVRYLRKHILPGKTKGFRIPVEKIPLYDYKGKVRRHEEFDWFKYVLGLYIRPDAARTNADDIEDSNDLVPQQPDKKNDEDFIDTLQSLKASADFVLERFLRREEALRPEAEVVRTFASGKGDKYKEEPVYRRADVERCLTAESWHKEGRRPKLGETPMKMVPVRAVTLTRKREAEEHERQYGEKQMQGLYSLDQTEYIIPPPIKDGVIPKNSYGNMDCFAPTMVPEGAVHIPLKGTVRICKKLDIDFAEAVTGFEFGNKRAVPVCTGVVVAKENERLVQEAWREWNQEQRRKEDAKLEKLVLDLWRKFVLGLRIRERVHDMYGDDIGVIEDLPTGLTREDAIAVDEKDGVPSDTNFTNDEDDEMMGGGFLLPHEEVVQAEELIMDDLNLQATVSAKGKTQDASATSTSIEHRDLQQTSTVNMASSDEMLDSERQDLDTSIEENSDNDSIENSLHDSAKQLRVSKVRLHNEMAKYVNSDGDNQDEDDKDENHDAISETGGSDGVSDEEKETYTPRSTRTRVAKVTASTTSTITPAPSRKAKSAARTQTKRTPKAKATQKAKSQSRITPKHELQEDVAGQGSAVSPAVPQTARRGRGRPRKTDSNPKNEVDRPKRSARLSRKESTFVTSPYFEE